MIFCHLIKRQRRNAICVPAAAIALVCCCISFAQGPGVQAGGSSKLRVDVNLVTVDVAVLDRKGAPIRNLKKEAFRLFEDGKEQEILSLDEVSAEPQAAPAAGSMDHARGKVVLILFDDSHLSMGMFKSTRDSAERYVKERMHPQDLFAVGAYNLSLQIVQNFTRDQSKVLDAIRKLGAFAESPEALTASKASAASRDSQRLGRPAPENQPRNTAALFQSTTYKAASLLRTLEALNTSLAQVKGRKAVILFSEEFPTAATMHNDYMKTVNSARTAGVAYYTIDARGLESLDGTGTGLTGGPQTSPATVSSRSRSRVTDIDPAQFEKQPMDAVLRPLAKETGGIAIYNTSDFYPRLDELDQELSNYYVLGFQSNNLRHDGKYRALEVKVAGAATVKSRSGYYETSPLDTLAGSKEERMLTGVLASGSPATQVPVALRAAYFYDSPTLARIPISARISASAIDIRKKGSQMGGDLHIMGVAYAEDGAVSARFSETQHILIDKEAEGTFRQRNLIYRNHFKLRPGVYRIKLAVTDEQGKVGSAEQPLEVPAPKEGRLAASSLVVSDQVSRLPDLIQSLQSRLLEDSDPLTFGGLQVSQSSDNQASISVPVQVFYKLYNLAPNTEPGKLLARVRLIDEKGAAQTLGPFPIDRNVYPTGQGEAMVGLNLPFNGVVPGKYKLEVETSEGAPGKSVLIQTDLLFK